MRADIVIIGSGFSGAMLAVHLARGARRPLTITLVERRDTHGLGTAYCTGEVSHLLNVPVGRMSALPDDPDHFHRWLMARGYAFTAQQFVPRKIYGDYLRALLAEAVGSSPGFTCLRDEAVGMSVSGDSARVHLRSGSTLSASTAVLALGNFPSTIPLFAGISNYIDDPWTASFFPRGDESVFLVGTGLTMVDVALSLKDRGHRGVVTAVSRHGLTPQPHRPEAVYSDFLGPAAAPLSVVHLVRLTRYHVRQAAAAGQDWQGVVDALRPCLAGWWRALPLREKQRFLRHVRVYWDTHRHRISESVARTVDEMRRTGALRILAGRVRDLRETENGRRVLLQLRGTRELYEIRAEYIINCTGPDYRYHQSAQPLLADLRRQGLIRADPVGIGADVDERGRLVSVDGEVCPRVFALGPLRIGQLWETTAVPEIRDQALGLARFLLSGGQSPVIDQQIQHPGSGLHQRGSRGIDA